MAARKVMIVRHAEKPAKHGGPSGVTLYGERDDHDLTPRGWQRAGALVTLFAPRSGRKVLGVIERPNAIYAAGVDAASRSRRSQLTVEPTAEALEPPLILVTTHCPGEEAKVARQIEASSEEVCLICWEHKRIKDLVHEITKGAIKAPHWNRTRFDVTFVLSKASGGWQFEEVPQMLLSRDTMAPVSEEILVK